MRKNAPSALSFFGDKPSTARLNDSEESHSSDKEILPPYSRQNDNAGKKKAASKRGPVILSEAKNLKNRFCQFLNCSPVNTPPPAAPGLLPCFRGAVRKD